MLFRSEVVEMARGNAGSTKVEVDATERTPSCLGGEIARQKIEV